MPNHGDWQFEIYLNGLTGEQPSLPMTHAELERRAEVALSPEIWSYVTGGAGDERTQRANVSAFERWGLMPRMLTGRRTVASEAFRSRCSTARDNSLRPTRLMA